MKLKHSKALNRQTYNPIKMILDVRRLSLGQFHSNQGNKATFNDVLDSIAEAM